MGAEDVFKDIYRRMEDAFYSFLDWLDAHGVPVYNAVDWLEDRGIPAFPAFLAVLLIVLAGIALLFGPTAVPTRSIMITVQDEYGNPVPGAQVILHAPGGATLTATTDESGTAYFDDVPEGPYSYEVLVDGRKIGEKVDVETDMDTIMLSPPEDESIRFCVQVLDDETGETIFGATVTAGSISFEYVNGAYCARVRDGALVSVGADGYEGKQVTAKPGYDEGNPYTVRLKKVSSVSSTGYKLTVTVVYEGSPVAARVRLIRGGSVLFEQTVPETTGTTSFSGLSPGEYTVVAFGEGTYSTLRIEKTININKDTSVTLDLKDGETIEPPAESPLKGEDAYQYSYTINGSSKPKLRVGKNTAKVCVKTEDDSIDTVEVSFGMGGKIIGGPAFLSPITGQVSCESITVSPQEEGTATLSIRFTAGGSVVKEYSETIPVEMTRFNVILCAKGDDGKRIAGAYIKVGTEEETTDSSGCASFLLPPGEYDVHIEADGYLPLDDKVNVSSHTSKTFTLAVDLESRGYHCEGDTCFQVLFNGLPSSQLTEGVTAGRPVTVKACARSKETHRVFIKNIAGSEEKTLATFTIQGGQTTRCVSRTVRPSEGTLAVEFSRNGETVYTDQVPVTVQIHTLTMCVYDIRERNGIPGAQITVGEASATTGEDGCVDIEIPAGRWTYKVTAEGYYPVSGTISVFTSLTKRVYMSPAEEANAGQYGTLKVCVRDAFSNKPVDEAHVHVGDLEWVTGEDGCVEDSIELGTYEVWAEKDGYVETETRTVSIFARSTRRVLLTMRPDIPGSIVFVGITSGGQPVAVLAGGTYTLEFSVTTPTRARRASVHVAVDEYQDILTVNGGKHAIITAPAAGRTQTVRVSLRVRPVEEKITLPIYYYLAVETDEGEYNLPARGGKVDVAIYPLRQAVACSRSGVGITIFPRLGNTYTEYLQAGVENEVVVLAGTCRPDVSVSDIVLTIQTPDGKKESTMFSGAGEPYRPEEHVYRITPRVQDIGMYVNAKVEAKQDTSILAVSEKKFQISYYQRDICLRVQVDPQTPTTGSSLAIRISPHLCQSANKLPDDWSAHRDDIKVQIVGGSAIPASMYGKQIPFFTTLSPRSHGDIVLACTSSYYTCRFDPPDTGTDKYVIWVYRGGLIRFSSDLYILPIISGEVYNEIPLKALNYTKYDVHNVSVSFECTNYSPGLWQFEVSAPSTIPASYGGEPGEADVMFSATWAGGEEPTETPECTVTLKGTYTLEEKEYAVVTTTKVRVNAGINIEGVTVSPLGEDGKIHIQTGMWKHFEVNITLPENVPFSDPSLDILLEADRTSWDLSEPQIIGNVVKYDLWLLDEGTANREYPLTLIFSAHVGVKDVEETVTYTVHAEYLPEILVVEPEEASFTIWPEGTPEPGKIRIVLTNKSAEQVTVSLSYEPDREFYTLSVEGNKGAYFTLNAGDRAELNVGIDPKKEMLGARSLSDDTQISIEYSIATPRGVERRMLEIPITVQYIPSGCLGLELMRDEVHKGETTVLVVKNECGTDVADIDVYETVNENTCKIGTVNIPENQKEAYIHVPLFNDKCQEPNHDSYISFQVSAPHVGESSRVALKYIAEETPYEEGTFYTCNEREPSNRRIAYAYDKPFTSKDSCDVAYCGYGEFYSALQEKLADAFKGAAEDASRFISPSQIPGCNPSEGWCALPVRSFSLYAKDGVQIIQLAELFDEKFAELVGTGGYYQYAGTYENTLSPSSIYTRSGSDVIDGCGRYTFIVQPYVEVTPGAVVYDHLAFVLTIKRMETDECKDSSVLNAHLHFNFGGGEGVEKGAVATLFFDAQSFLGTAGMQSDLVNALDAYVEELKDMNAVKVYKDRKLFEAEASERAIVLEAGSCPAKNKQYPLAKITWKNNKLTFTFCAESADQLTSEIMKKIIEGWLAGPNTNVAFSGCLADDTTFFVYGVVERKAGISGTHEGVKLMPGIPGKIELDFHKLGICPEGMRCYYKVNKILIAYEAIGGASSQQLEASGVAEYTFYTPAAGRNVAETKGNTTILTDGSVLIVELTSKVNWGDQATIVLILKPANEYGEEVQEKRVVIPVEIVGLTADDLINAVRKCKDKEIQEVWNCFVNELNNAAQGLLAMEDDGSMKVWFKEEVKYERIRDYLQQRRSELIREFNTWDLKWCDIEGNCVEIPGATTQKRIEAAGNPALWITYGGVCFSTAAGCIAATFGLDIPDAVGSAIACGLPAAMGWMQSPLLQYGFTQALTQAIPGAVGGAPVGVAGAGIVAWRGWNKFRVGTRRGPMWLVGRGLSDPLRLIVAEDPTVVAEYISSGLANKELRATNAGMFEGKIRYKILTKEGKEIGTLAVEKSDVLFNADELAKVLKSKEGSELIRNVVSELPDDELVKIVKNLSSDELVDLLQNLDEKTLKLVKKIYRYEGEDPGKLAKEIAKDPKRLRRTNVLAFLRKNLKQVGVEIIKQLALGFVCDVAGIVAGTSAATLVYNESYSNIPALVINQGNGMWMRISETPYVITILEVKT